MNLIDALKHRVAVRRVGEEDWLDSAAIIKFMEECIPIVDLLADDWEVDKVDAKASIKEAVARRIQEIKRLKRG